MNASRKHPSGNENGPPGRSDGGAALRKRAWDGASVLHGLAAFLLLAAAAFASDPATLSLTGLNGEPQTLEAYRGRVLVLNFWATWCVPCREEMPLLSDIYERYGPKGVVVIGASADDESTRAQIEPFVKELGIRFPIWTGATIRHMEQLGLGAALPATAIIDQEGRIAFRIIGVLKGKDLTRRLDYLLAGRSGKAPERLLDTLSEARDQHGHEGHDHGEGEGHAHGGASLEGASLVPS